MNWKEEFERLDIMNCDCEHCVEISKEDIVRFITNLLEEQRTEAYNDGEDSVLQDIKTIKQDLINQILSEAPEEMQPKCKVKYDKDGEVKSYNYYNTSIAKGFNQANAQWMEIINKLK